MKTKATLKFFDYVLNHRVLYTTQGINKKRCKLFLGLIMDQINFRVNTPNSIKAEYYEKRINYILKQRSVKVNRNKYTLMRIFRNLTRILTK